MKVLLVGSGGREHALARCLLRSPLLTGLWVAPGNPGILAEVAPVPVVGASIPADEVEGLVALALEHRFDLTIIGPEVPLARGLVDRLSHHGLLAFGPTAQAAELESSKAFAKALMARHGIPTAAFEVFSSPEAAYAHLETCDLPIVIKADGLAAGKGVVIAQTREEALEAARDLLASRVLGEAGARVVIEAFLEGEEVSFLAICDGTRAVALASSQDHKRAYDGDQGPNTGGMGAVSPSPLLTDGLKAQVMNNIVYPTLRAMASEGRAFRGVMFAGLMVKDGIAKVLEFNCRFGDPETQAILTRLDEDLLPILRDAAKGTLEARELAFREEAAVTVILASQGYPLAYEKGREIRGVEKAEALPGVSVYHAGTALKEGRLVTAGGRVLAVTALGTNLATAISRAYEACALISWEGKQLRMDIGQQALRQLG